MAVLRIHAPVLGHQERVFEWDGRPITIGRDDTCDVVLLEQAASRHHARLERHGAEVRLIDSESANGVWVGNERVVGSRPLHDGDVVRIGDTTLTLVLDPHRQATIIREPGGAPAKLADAPTVARLEPATEPAAPSPRADIGSSPTLAAEQSPAVVVSSSTEPALVSTPPPAQIPAPIPAVAPHHPIPASSASAYSLGSEPTLAAQSGPNMLGIPDRSSPSEYSIGEAATIAPHGEPGASGPLLPSSSSVYSLGHEAPSRAHEPAMGLQLASSSSVYSIGDASGSDFRGPDTPELPPAPSFEGVASSAGLGTPPPPPGLPPGPRVVEAPRPPPLVTPRSPRSAASSWEWTDPPPQHRHHRRRSAQPILWLGVGLLIGGIVAIIVALAAGYEPSELGSLLGLSAIEVRS